MSDELKKTAAPHCAEVFQSEYAPLIDELYRQEVLEARRMPAEQKLILGERLFRWACSVTLAGIRLQNPTATEAECRQTLRDRIELGKKLGAL